METSEGDSRSDRALEPLRNRLRQMSREELIEYALALHYLIGTHGSQLQQVLEELKLTNLSLAETNHRLAEALTHDLKTGLLNANGLNEALDREVARLALEGGQLLLVFADLMHLKTVNNYLGHAYGDELISYSVELIRTRPYDLIGRVGGDEFVIVLVDSERGAFDHIIDQLGEVAHLGENYASWSGNQRLTPSEASERRQKLVEGANRKMIEAKARLKTDEDEELRGYLESRSVTTKAQREELTREWWLDRLASLQVRLHERLRDAPNP